MNLVGNAVKFTQTGSVTLALARSNDGARLSFSVTDTGIGIPESARAGLFTPYVQAEESTARRFGGTGLGLAISRRLVDAMGGTIGFDSTPGIGSRFWIELPLESVAAHDVPAAPAAEPAVQPNTIAGACVLVAEDEITSRAVIAGQLARLGIHATVVEDGAQAFAAYDTRDFDLLITDCRMPVMDGFALTRKIRAVERSTGTHIPILALTADASQAEVESCREAGMDDYLSKPATLAQLTERIGALLAGRARVASEQHPSWPELVS